MNKKNQAQGIKLVMRKLYLELHFIKINQANEIENFKLQTSQRANS